jgi:hypothetical protein
MSVSQCWTERRIPERQSLRDLEQGSRLDDRPLVEAQRPARPRGRALLSPQVYYEIRCEAPDGLAVVDFDVLRLAPAALNPATYAARLVFGGPADLDDASDARSRSCSRPTAAARSGPPGTSRRPSSGTREPPFRYLDEHWPERVERMVTAAETVLDR